MRIKWLIAMLLAFSLMLAGCGQTPGNTAMDSAADEKKPQTVPDTENMESMSDVSSEDTDSMSELETAGGEGYPEFDFASKIVTLNSDYDMPILGLGGFYNE